MNRVAAMRACLFGPPPNQLFGLFEEPATSGASELGVVLCYPHGAEYATAFRSFRILGNRLAKAGFHVLRFDYLGTGDSAGDADDASVSQWTADVVAAVHELAGSRDLREISAVGLRLGATLAALAAQQCDRIHRLVLWEPVINGRDYVQAQRALQAAWLEQEIRSGRVAPVAQEDVLGYALTERLCHELESVNLSALPKAPAPYVHVVSRGSSPDYEQLVERFRQQGAQVEMDCVEGPSIGSGNPLIDVPPVPNAAMQAIVASLRASSR